MPPGPPGLLSDSPNAEYVKRGTCDTCDDDDAMLYRPLTTVITVYFPPICSTCYEKAFGEKPRIKRVSL